MKNTIQEVIDRIKIQHIKPEPRWRFLMSVYGRWLAFTMIVALGAIALSIMVTVVSGLDWDAYSINRQNKVAYFFSLLPYAWIGVLLVLAVLSFIEIRKTETGYRYSQWLVNIMVVCSIVFMGIFFSFFHFGNVSNRFLESHAPYYQQHLVVTKESQWTRPEQGFLSGIIISISGKNIVIEDIYNKQWVIVINDATLIKPTVSLQIHERIKIIGTISDDTFHADEIRPWEGMSMMKNMMQ